MITYLELLRDVRLHGERQPTRAHLKSTGEPIDALSLFGRQARYDLRSGFPVVTTKRLAFTSLVHELIWFLRGESNIAYLREHRVTIWDEWADEHGDLGPVYGKQWRAWPTSDGGTIDQIKYVLEGIKRLRDDPTDPVGRRLIVTAWNPAEIDQMALPPCHTLFQFYVAGDSLSCQLYQRSADLFLGVPFNIASYALLTCLVARETGLKPLEFVHTIGDAHIYTNHLDQVDEQLSRTPFPAPELWIAPEFRTIEQLDHRQVKLLHYQYHPTLKGEVAV